MRLQGLDTDCTVDKKKQSFSLVLAMYKVCFLSKRKAFMQACKMAFLVSLFVFLIFFFLTGK